MTQIVKAAELVLKFNELGMPYFEAVQCAIIAVKEIMNCASNIQDAFIQNQIEWYWNEVLTELERM